MKKNILKTKSYEFALTVVSTCNSIIQERKEFILSKQFLRCGTATGALIREAEYAQSKADFISKLSIALKESNEADYWISLLKDLKIIDDSTAQSLSKSNKELKNQIKN